MKKLALFTALLLLFSVAAGCAGGGTPVGTDTASTASTTTGASPSLSSSSLPDTGSPAPGTDASPGTEAPSADLPVDLTAAPFRIITNPKESGTQLSEVLSAFVTRLKSIDGLSFTVASDTMNDGSDGLAEIVIGNADRPGCAEICAEFGPLDWSVTCSSGRIYLCGGTPDMTAKAVYWLLANYVAKNILTVPAGVLYRSVSPVKLPDIPDPQPYEGRALKGLTVFAIGDSYFAGQGLDPKKEVWPALLAMKQGETFENYGIGGSTLSDYITTNTPVCRRISSMKAGDPDIVILEGGANDWNHCVPLGEPGSTDTKTFRGAAASCIEQLHAKYPDAFIVCVTNWDYGRKNSQNVESTAYAEAFCEVAARYPFAMPVNASDTSVIPAFVTNSAFRAKYCISSTDQSHLNAEGMRLLLPFFEKIIGEGYEKFRK